MKAGKVLLSPFLIRLIGAAVGCAGFIFLAYGRQVPGTAFIGIGSLIIAAAGK